MQFETPAQGLHEIVRANKGRIAFVQGHDRRGVADRQVSCVMGNNTGPATPLRILHWGLWIHYDVMKQKRSHKKSSVEDEFRNCVADGAIRWLTQNSPRGSSSEALLRPSVC